MPGFSTESSHPQPSSPAYYRRSRTDHGLRTSRSTKSSESFSSSPRAGGPPPVTRHHVNSRQSSSESLEPDVRLVPARIQTKIHRNSEHPAGDTFGADERTPRQGDRRYVEKPPLSGCSSSAEMLRKSRSRTSHHNNETAALANEHPFVVDEDLLANPNSQDLGPLLLRLATALHLSGENSAKALECATRAAKFLEKAAGGKPSLDLVMSLHILAAIHCRSGQYEEAIPILQRALTIPDLHEGVDHALAAFAGYMQLGDILALRGQLDSALSCYKTAYRVQKDALGEMDPQVGETCSYLAEANLKALQFQQAEEYCEHALKIHSVHSQPGSFEEAADRRLMALILSGKGDHETALEHLVLASAALRTSGKDADVAAVDCSIGDAYAALGRYEEAIFSYQKSLNLFKSIHGESHSSVAAVYVNLAVLFMKMRKYKESKTYCESALRIYGKPNAGHSPDELASGLTEIASVFENMGEREQALFLLQRALDILEALPGQQSAVAGVEAQMGVLYYYLGKYEESFLVFKSAVSKLQSTGEKKSAQLGIVLNQMGLACVGLNEIWSAADTFEESRRILEEAYGPHHTETLAVCSNLAGAYDALGRSDEAIRLLEHILEVKEERLGTVHPEVEDERARLSELLKEAGRSRIRKTNTLEELLLISNIESSRYQAKKSVKS
ncbi:hypothetical protein KP509_30G012300 [Ceratopteris richardii]|uniref:Kinesin light chain n=1 Tax=Ceratopteris richardii TaxID=49495 RepID=A0A8T2R1D7_CERRI|nr:hypothetical protein KP509_30G012300 [Ceratopteris richardii]